MNDDNDTPKPVSPMPPNASLPPTPQLGLALPDPQQVAMLGPDIAVLQMPAASAQVQPDAVTGQPLLILAMPLPAVFKALTRKVQLVTQRPGGNELQAAFKGAFVSLTVQRSALVPELEQALQAMERERDAVAAMQPLDLMGALSASADDISSR